MKPSFEYRSAFVVALLAATVLGISTAAQAPNGATDAPPPPLPRKFPAPTNLKVLPKDSTGEQVQQIMQEWSDQLGVRCSSCHAEDAYHSAPDGQPLLIFADDSKPMKGVARMMYTMTDEINTNYIAKIEGSGIPVTCGTCHLGKLSPEPFEVKKGPPLVLGPVRGEGPPPPR